MIWKRRLTGTKFYLYYDYFTLSIFILTCHPTTTLNDLNPLTLSGENSRYVFCSRKRSRIFSKNNYKFFFIQLYSNCKNALLIDKFDAIIILLIFEIIYCKIKKY
jgi:hypothetical protein